MFTIWGATKHLPRGAVSRREILRIGGLGIAGLTFPGLFRARTARAAAAARDGSGGAKACIVLWMRGGPSHQDTWDLKPDMPVEIRGEFKPIDTDVPGIRISEHFPLLAKHADKYAVVRSVTHGGDYSSHEAAHHNMLTGNLYKGPVGQLTARYDDYPNFGSVLNYLRPNRLTSICIGESEPVAPGMGAGFVGKRYEPALLSQRKNFQLNGLILPKEVPLERLADRRDLLDTINRQAEGALHSSETAGMDTHYRKAFELLASPQARKALDLSAEPDSVRERYGRNSFGQSALLARRLVEHGMTLVTVYYVEGQFGPAGPWDTHTNNFPALKNGLMPPTDRGFAALLEDLSMRGLLDQTLVVWMGEFGRTPNVFPSPGGARDHWPKCQSVVLAGGGIKGGQVYGSSAKDAGYPRDNPVHTNDLGTTIYHCLGVGADTEVPDQLGRPNRICSGNVVWGLFR